MALKDLIATRLQINESAIENIVQDLVRYDPDKGDVILTPTAAALPNKTKLLAYLVALEGWAYVRPDLSDIAAKPVGLERELGIPGGTLRPLLRDLAAQRLVKSEGGAYRIVTANLPAITAEFERQDGDPPPAKTAKRASRVKRKPSPGPVKSPSQSPAKKAGRPAKSGGAGGASMFNQWIDAGFFKKPKSMKDMLQEFHNKGVIMKMTALSKLPLGAVRAGRLNRHKGDQDGRQVWLYTSGD